VWRTNLWQEAQREQLKKECEEEFKSKMAEKDRSLEQSASKKKEYRIQIQHLEAEVRRLQNETVMPESNIGKYIRKVFFVNGSRGDVDYYEGKVHSITANNKYLVIYSDGDSEEMNHRENSSSP
jgi:predicted RNase H-like nuclease (RuvC/YqgF family)